MINIKIQKKDLWLLSAIGIFLVGVAYVIAYGSGDPQIHGHDASEIAIQTVQAVGTTDITSPATETDMSDMSITLNTETETKILIIFSAPFWAPVLNTASWLKLYVDGVEIRKVRIGQYAYFDAGSFQHVVDGLTPGSHTIKITWWTVPGFNNVAQRGSTDGQRVLTVIEL